MTNFLCKLSTKYSKLTLFFSILIGLFSIVHAVFFLKFDTNQDSLISDKQQYFINYQNFLKEFGDWEYVYLVIRSIDAGTNFTPQAKKLSEELTLKLKKRPDLFEEIVNKIDYTNFQKSLLLLLPEPAFNTFVDTMQSHPETIRAFLSIQSSADWYRFINELLDAGSKDNFSKEFAGPMLEKIGPFFEASLLAPFNQDSLAQIQKDKLAQFSDLHLDPEGFLFSNNGHLLFIRILPKKNYSKMEIIAEPLSVLRSEIEKLRPKYPDLEFGITGRPVLQNDEASSTQSDSTWAGMASFLLVSLLIFAFFKSYKRSVFALLALVIGIAWTTGFISIIFGKINLLTIVFAVILIGLGIDYGIHFLIRYQEERRLVPADEAIFRTTQFAGIAILIGAATSAIAFVTAVFTDFLGLQQLGAIVGVGIIFCCLAELLVLPALLNLFDRNEKNQSIKTPSCVFLNHFNSKPQLVLFVFLILTLLCIPLSLQVTMNHNLMELQDPNLESVKYERLIQEDTEISTWFLGYKTKNLKKLSEVRNEINHLPSVAKTESILDLMPETQNDRFNKIAALKKNIFTHSNQRVRDNHSSSLANELKILKYHFEKLANQTFSSGMLEEFDQINNLNAKLTILTVPNESVAPLEIDFMNTIRNYQTFLTDLLNPTLLSEKMIPPSLLKNYKSAQGYYSLTIYPKDDIWEPQNMKTFIEEVRSIIPNATGAPVTTYESAKKMKSGFLLVGILTSILSLIFLYANFRCFKTAGLIFVSLLTSFVWLLAFMKLANISINLANFFALPVLIGSGVDHGIHIFHRYREMDHSITKNNFNDLYTSTIPAVILSCLTTIFGFASLSFVRHRGLASFGMIMAVGTFIIMMVSVMILPVCIKLFYKSNRGPHDKTI